MGPVDVTVRSATRTDLVSIVQIERACFDDPWPYDSFEQLIAEPAFLVAETDGAVVGYVIADVRPDVGRDIGHIKNLAVHPHARNRGIGTTLLRTALARLHTRDVAVARLEVRESNAAARSLYANEGFDPIRRIRRYYRDGEDALVLVTDLTAWAAGG